MLILLSHLRPLRPLFSLILVLGLGLAACDLQQDLGHSSHASCRQGLTGCDNRCVDTLSDPGHCGACGVVCPPDKLCQAGTCVSSCSQPYNACSGACVILYQDDQHCGACPNVCMGTQHCDNGACSACSAGSIHCLTASGQGWRCVNLATDSLHCGGCGNSCTPGQQCSDGTCR